MTSRLHFLALSVALCMPTLCTAAQQVDVVLTERWKAIVSELQPQQPNIAGIAIVQETNATKRRLYKKAIERLVADARQGRLDLPNTLLATDQTLAADQRFVENLQAAGAEKKAAKSVDSRSTNPMTAGLAERSGFTEFIALALNSKGFFAADQNAVTLNLNALALYSLADSEVYTDLLRYQQHSALRRLSGSVTFGAKIPEKQITGISGLPDADKLLDVFTWDVKVRLLGDRDARSERWYPLTLGLGDLREKIAGVVKTLVPAEDVALVEELFAADLGAAIQDIKETIAKSVQLSFKTSGTHLTEEVGRNKYSGELLFDAGLGMNADVTANLLYSVTEDVRLGAQNAFTVKQLTVNAALTTHFGQDAIIKGRAVGWNSGLAVTVFQNKSSIPIPVDNTWKLYTTFEIPVTDAANVPLSVVYSNDPNALTKQKYVTGFVGINYDFSALGKLFKGDQAGQAR